MVPKHFLLSQQEKILLIPMILTCCLSGHSVTLLCRNEAEAPSPDGNANLPEILVAQILGFALGDSKAHKLQFILPWTLY